MATAPASSMRSLDRALDVLGVLEDIRQPLRLSDVARRADLHVATAQRILNVLVERGYAAKEDAGYVAGPADWANCGSSTPSRRTAVSPAAGTAS